MKNINYKFLTFCLLLLIACTFLLTGCGGSLEIEDIQDEEKETKEEVQEEIEEDVEEEIVVGDFSKFSDQNQEIGNVGNETYTITSFSEKSMEGFHRFTFEVEGEKNLPNVVASYRAEIGAIRLLFKEIGKDNSGLGYQKSHEVEEDGVVRLFHNVSPDEKEEIYDVGVAKSTVFLLHSEKVEDGKWKINLDVRYPGELDIDVDRGTDEFGTDEQIIDGATSSDGARITNYSYGVEGNAFQFIWTVRGSESKPIPQVRARYNDDGHLVVTFPDLDSDYIGRDNNEAELMGGVEKVSWNRVGSETIYRFFLKDKKDFRLKSSLSPNQVILEIEL